MRTKPSAALRTAPLAEIADAEKLWEEAADTWIARQSSPHTRAAYRQALDLLLRFTGRDLGSIGGREINLWVTAMAKEEKSPATISCRISAVRAFYDFARYQYLVTDEQGKQKQLRSDNPAALCKAPKVSPYGKAVCLDDEQVRALLRAIPGRTLADQRNKAMFIGYLLLGLRNSELRLLKYEDLEQRPEGVFMRYKGKGKRDQLKEVVPPVLEAIQRYSMVDQKFTGYIFHRYTPQGGIIDLPVSDQTVRDALKYYARQAGIRTKGLVVHSLRHTAAYARFAITQDIEDARIFLNQDNPQTTGIYLRHLKPRPDKTWMTVAERFGMSLSDVQKV